MFVTIYPYMKEVSRVNEINDSLTALDERLRGVTLKLAEKELPEGLHDSIMDAIRNRNAKKRIKTKWIYSAAAVFIYGIIMSVLILSPNINFGNRQFDNDGLSTQSPDMSFDLAITGRGESPAAVHAEHAMEMEFVLPTPAADGIAREPNIESLFDGIYNWDVNNIIDFSGSSESYDDDMLVAVFPSEWEVWGEHRYDAPNFVQTDAAALHPDAIIYMNNSDFNLAFRYAPQENMLNIEAHEDWHSVVVTFVLSEDEYWQLLRVASSDERNVANVLVMEERYDEFRKDEYIVEFMFRGIPQRERERETEVIVN
jgi:hypothetical protein